MAASAPDLPRLTILSGPLAGKELVLEEVVDNILIGADASCRFHLALPGISPIHARIWMDAAGVTVYDTHSPRGLYVNDDRVSGQVPLRNGDILWLGTPGEEEAVMIQCRFPSRAAVAAPAAPAAAAVESEGESTMMMSAPSLPAPVLPVEADGLEVVEEPAAAAFELEAVEESGADATMVLGPVEDEAMAVPLEPEADSTVAMAAPAAPLPVDEPDSDATLVGGADAFYIQDEERTQAMPAVEDEPAKFAVDMPAVPEIAAPEAPAFEDETQISDVPFALPPVTAFMPEADPEPAPRYEPPPAVMAPPPTPVPAPRPVAPASPEPTSRPVRPSAPAPKAPVSEAPRPRASSPGGGGRYVAFGVVGLLVLVGGGFLAWRLLQSKSSPAAPPPTTLVGVSEAPATTLSAAPPPRPTTPPETTPPAPVVEEMVTIVKSPPPSAAPGASPSPSAKASPGAKATPPPKVASAPTPPPVSPEVARAQQTAAQVASLLGQAQSAAAARNYDGAAQFYEEVLKLEPQNPQAMEGRSTAQAAALSLKKTFVAGKTTVRSEKAAKGPAGFDTEDVSVAKAPDYSGRIEFEANPRNVKPGDNYTILVYLMNDGKKGFKLGTTSVTTAVNGAKSGGSIQTKVKDIDPQQRLLLAEMPGVWQGSTTSWSIEVLVASSRGDTFRNLLTWK